MDPQPTVAVSAITPQIDKLAAALSAAQAKIVAPKKTRKVDFTDRNGRRVTYMYADLADVIECIKTEFGANGLSHSEVLGYQHMIPHPGAHAVRMYGLTTYLIHSSGQMLTSWYPLPDPSTKEIRAQEFGSAITYARRYSLSALAGVASEEDDDGSAAADTSPPRQQQQRQSKPPAGKTKGERHTAKPPADVKPKDESPASDHLYMEVDALCGELSIGQDKIAYLVRKGFGMDPQGQVPTWVVQDIIKTMRKDGCTEATILARAETLKAARVARGMAETEPSAPPTETDQEKFNREMDEHVGLSEPEPVNPHDQVSQDPIDKNYETYVIPEGKFKGKKLIDIGVLEAGKYVDWLHKDAKEKNRSVSGWAQELIYHYQHFAAALNRK